MEQIVVYESEQVSDAGLWGQVMLTAILPIGALIAAAQMLPLSITPAESLFQKADQEAVIQYDENLDIQPLRQTVRRITEQGVLVSFAQVVEGEDRLQVTYNAGLGFCGQNSRNMERGMYALDRLGADFRFSTRYYLDGRIKNNVLVGDLIIALGGNPVMTHNEVREVVRELRLYGIEEIDGNIVYTDQVSTRTADETGEKTPDPPPFYFNHNVYAEDYREQKLDGSQREDRFLSLPQWPRQILEIPVQYGAGRGLFEWSNENALLAIRGIDLKSSEILARGYRRGFSEPKQVWLNALKHELKQFGIEVKGQLKPGDKPEEAVLFSIQYSPYLPSLLKNLYGDRSFGKYAHAADVMTVRSNILRSLTWAEKRQEWLERRVTSEANVYLKGFCGDGWQRIDPRILLKELDRLAHEFEVGSDWLSALPTAAGSFLLQSDALGSNDLIRGAASVDQRHAAFVGYIQLAPSGIDVQPTMKRVAVELTGGDIGSAERHELMFQLLRTLAER